MPESNSPSSRKPESRVILEFDREVTDAEIQEMQAKHNATSAFLEAADHHDHDHTPDVVDMGEVDQ
ncbi:hypothetical protein ACPCK2_28045 [Streptomyces pseudogriseolus]|uniref:hypothetical protein n=1 Tax=Streptomyces pseudogriseolus TaxID=36817 RepID=UPI003FA221B5